MGQLQTDIQVLIGAQYGRGIVGAKIAKRLIEAGLNMMDEEGDLHEDSRIVPTYNSDGDFCETFHVAERHALEAGTNNDLAQALGRELTPGVVLLISVDSDGEGFSVAAPDLSTNALLECAWTFRDYAIHHLGKTPPDLEKATRNKRMAKMCLSAIGYDNFQELPPREADLPVILADDAAGILDEFAGKADFSPVQSESKARSSDGTPALSVQPSRSEIASWINEKARVAASKGETRLAEVLISISGEIEQHLEERPVNVAQALREFYADCHSRNVKAGWWTDLATGVTKKRSVGELFMLMVTELWEAYEAYMTGEPDDKLPQYPGLGVELGDLQIRLADFCGALAAGSVVEYHSVRNPGDLMFQEVGAIAARYESIRKTDAAVGDEETGDYTAPADVGEMVVAKLEFNANRPDHKIENRLKDDGKRT